MIVVMQCAGKKRKHAGFLKSKDERPVWFVARPDLAPRNEDRIYARPDDASDHGGTWRDVLLDYNGRRSGNPLGLLPAFELYENDIYRELVKRFGVQNTYILSAGWGLINAAFLTPDYDITFSHLAEDFARRRKRDVYRDLCMLAENVEGPIVLFGSKEYVPLFTELTRSIQSPRIVFYNSIQPPLAPGCVLQRFETRTRTNWQYECASAFLRGSVRPELD